MLLQKEAEIAQLKMIGNTNEHIADACWVDVLYVTTILKDPKVITWMEEAELSALSRGVELTRLRSARDILPFIIDGIRKIASEIEAEKWNKNHVELFKMLILNLAKEDAKALQIIQNTYVQNNTIMAPRSALSWLDEKLGKIPARKQAEFWRDVEDLVTKYTKYDETKILQQP